MMKLLAYETERETLVPSKKCSKPYSSFWKHRYGQYKRTKENRKFKAK